MSEEEVKALIKTAQYKYYKTYVEGLEKEFDALEERYDALKKDYERLRNTSQRIVQKNKALQTVVEKLKGVEI